jgi:NAD(P)-dependent dehydrogenase (short-subunit alcohol dehydrogenase family)
METKNYVVIGGSSGIGRNIVNQLQQKGHTVFVVSRSKHELPDNPKLIHIQCDVTKEDIPSDQFPESIDGLVYCPGTIRLRPFNRLKDADFVEDFHVNTLGAVRAIRTFLPVLKTSNGASIVLFSTVAVQIGMPYHASIASAKGAIEGLTRSLAAELAPKIRVNAIAPSLTETPLAKSLLATDQKRQLADNRHPLQRFGQPEDIANAAVYLLEQQSSWVTGQILHIDGGISSLKLL